MIGSASSNHFGTIPWTRQLHLPTEVQTIWVCMRFFCISLFKQHENFQVPIHAWMILKPKSIKETGLVFKLKWSRKFLSKDRNNCMTLRSKCRICKPTDGSEVCKTKTRLCKCTWLPIDPAVAYFRPKFNSRQGLQEAHGPRFTAALMGDFKFRSPLFTQVIIC